MNVFELIKSVLDESYDSIPGDEAQRDATIKAQLSELSDRYRQLRSVSLPRISYSDPATRFAYIYRYVTCHANLVYSRIANQPSLQQLFERDHVQVACIGGGPGSDFLGLLKYCLKRGKAPKLKCILFDGDPSWNESWLDVDDKVATSLQLSTVFTQFDVCEPASYTMYDKYLRSDLFTMIYFMSEVYRFKAQAEPYFRHLFENADNGALFLFVDNNNSDFYGWFDGLVSDCGLKVVGEGEAHVGMPTDEEKTSLGTYYNKFSFPKLGADVAYRIVQK